MCHSVYGGYSEFKDDLNGGVKHRRGTRMQDIIPEFSQLVTSAIATAHAAVHTSVGGLLVSA